MKMAIRSRSCYCSYCHFLYKCKQDDFWYDA